MHDGYDGDSPFLVQRSNKIEDSQLTGKSDALPPKRAIMKATVDEDNKFKAKPSPNAPTIALPTGKKKATSKPDLGGVAGQWWTESSKVGH